MSTSKDDNIPTNDAIVDEITKTLADSVELNADEDEEGNPPVCEKLHITDDCIDEDELKREEETLTEEEKAERRTRALALKNEGNDLFKAGSYLDSIKIYTTALNTCPLSCADDRAILYANRAASKIPLERKKAAIDDCTKAVELNPNYVRAYLRRAKLYEEETKLDESLEDYRKVLEFDRGNVEALKATVRLPPLIDERNEKMKTEMLGKLKDLGNMVLKPFGLSTDNFKLEQDPSGGGGYKINFQQKPQ